MTIRTVLCRISTHTPPRGVTYNGHKEQEHENYFYSHPSARGDSCVVMVRLSNSDFYSHPSARGDQRSTFDRSCNYKFLLTPLREG